MSQILIVMAFLIRKSLTLSAFLPIQIVKAALNGLVDDNRDGIPDVDEDTGVRENCSCCIVAKQN